ncbi:hypothetical protein [Saccharomonospora viridis]|jgi:hypothetical protein|uniref:Uncharacterized protein n=2 Tax=Saccharomonospora viridis TaxID=1852 RepID=C7MYI3_SACVD|nr:hypothetical protein [Saccharomonospora viridis]ACU97402.1 hypothetical protein Svir_24050 [Saccharomonospora viridis DSM 43017]KHF43772.1 hypothetical protein MINT15_24970 [Saccharomonospora viridis]SFP84203.1 hypothetical protein SAMN02982918_3575 [Saccharomonospora viridis]
MTEDSGTERHPRFDDDLIGLDPDDPEARAFAEHLDRMQRCDPAFTVEGSLRGVAEFADGSNRAGGLRWWVAVLVVCLILMGVLVSAWDILGDLLAWLER